MIGTFFLHQYVFATTVEYAYIYTAKFGEKKIGGSIWGKLTKYDDLVAVCSYKRKLYIKVGIDTLQFQGLYFMKSPREIFQNLPYFGFLIYQKYSGRVTNFDIFSLREHFIGHKQP